MAGIVYLIGAGPGDEGLLTLKGRDCIAKADVIVYDYLADKQLLAYAAAEAELIYVGKQANNHTLRQEEINALLVEKAKAGKVVARLKGGDPFVFGRGGEEALALQAAKLPFEIVPGVTSAIAAAAYAGIPVTHRRVAASFAVVTGHEDPSRACSGINWANLATGVDTLVFLMGVGNLAQITKQLIDHGRSAETPAALVRWGTKNEQQVLVTTVGTAAADVQKQHFQPPAIFIVGEVVKLREKLRWFDNRPLFGKRILVTRARAQASELTKRLQCLGARCIEAPVIEIVEPDDAYASLDGALAQLQSYDWLIFTSPNGVDCFFARLLAKGLDARALANAQVAAIGSSTAKALLKFGIKADLVPPEYKAEVLVQTLKPLVAHKRILIPRAKEARQVLPEQLRQADAVVDVVQCYKTAMAQTDYEAVRKMLQQGEIDLVTFTSSSTVKNFLTLVQDQAILPQTLEYAAIGPITEATCRKYGLRARISAQVYTLDGLTKAIEEYFSEKKG